MGMIQNGNRKHARGFKRLDLTDAWRTCLILALGTIAIFLTAKENSALLTWHLYGSLSALCILILAAQYFRLAQVWKPLKGAIQSTGTGTSKAKHLGLREHFYYLIAYLMFLSIIAFLSGSDVWLLRDLQIATRPDAAVPLHLLCFCMFFVSAFLPLTTGVWLQAHAEAKKRNHSVFQHDVVSRGTIILVGGLLGAIIALAVFAGAGKIKVDENFGVYVTFIVVLAFLAFVAAPHVMRFLNDRDQQPLTQAASAGPAHFYPERFVSYIDSGLVRLIAPLTGATQSGTGMSHLIFLCLVIPLSAMGFALASPFGLAPIILAMLLVLALGRRWAWVENDRETASRLQSTDLNKVPDIRIGFDNDLKDEALLGYASLFFLVPLALYQIDGVARPFSNDLHPDSYLFGDWLRFFGAELAKAVPFVDWWEIYRVEVGAPFEAETAGLMAKHLTFASRAIVDLVIMAALFQAIGIWQRSRMQKRLYSAGHIDALDPFTELDFFERGMTKVGSAFVPKQKFVDNIKAHFDNCEQLDQLPVPYSAKRLSELINSENAEARAAAKWMIETYGVLAGTPQEKLQQLNSQWANLLLPQLAAAGTPQSREVIRMEKLRFEQLLLDLKRELEVGYLPLANAGLLLHLLEETQGAPEFSFARILALELLATKNDNEFSLAALAAHLMTTSNSTNHLVQRPEWMKLVISKFGRWPKIYLRNFELRRHVYDALETFASNVDPSSRRWKQLLDLLDWMAESDASQQGRAKAAALTTRLRSEDT